MKPKKAKPMAKFEKSGKDKEPRGMKEGSKREENYDKQQQLDKMSMRPSKPVARNKITGKQVTDYT
jgi:hypothetical protein